MQKLTDSDGFDGIELLSGLDGPQKRALAERCEKLSVRRGEVLVRQGEPADALFVIVSGRFVVSKDGRRDPIAEIGPGQPVGEIAFLTGGTRTATVRALRDGLALRLGREEFDELSARDPDIWRSLALTLAGRLASTTAAVRKPPDPRPRTITVIRAGGGPLPQPFLDRFVAVLGRSSRVAVVTAETVAGITGQTGGLDTSSTTRALNDLEMRSSYVIYVADDEVTAWTEKAIRHADLVIAVGWHASNTDPNPLEQRAAELLAPDARRLVLVHQRRTRVAGTRRWLAGRAVAMHHHVAIDRDEDVERLERFIAGTARGLVACGGGALCATHVGVYRALTEAGMSFDMLGGTSAGSAMTAAFLLRTAPDEIVESIHDMFVANRAMRRYTLPRYSLIDHGHFDAQLKRYFGGNDIEDLWLPYFAVSTNLSTFALHVHRRGDLWTAVRASGSIPVLLPPIYTAEGEMLVDGGLLDNVPIRLMHELKSGPNVVVSFLVPEMERFDVSYDSLPKRAELLKRLLIPFGQSKLPPAPSLITVLMRSLMANRDDYHRHLTPDDLLLVPPIPPEIGFLDWHRHRELYEAGYKWACERMREKSSDP
ncbi:MAG: patatin-like phospholipase family protein [Hyphomicrobium sp.]